MSRTVKIISLVTIGSLFAVSVGAGVIAQQQQSAIDAGAAQPTASNQFAILVTTIAGFASLLATHLFQFYREARNRKWDLSDRMAARAEMRNHAETQRLETIQTAVELARVSNINRAHLRDAIDLNTKISSEAADKADAAYVAANNFNAKLEALHKELRGLQNKATESKERKEK